MSEINISCQPLLDKLTHILIKTNLIKKFMLLDTIEKKVKFCVTSRDIKYDDSISISIWKELNDLIELFYSLSAKHEKSVELADHFKTKGSKAFLKKKDDEAFKFYTEGLRHAPQGSPIVALLYANRSATHIQRKNYEDCLMDIERAERAGYPSDSKQKLGRRKIEALLKLEKHKEAYNNFKSIKDILPSSDRERISKSLNELEEQLSSLKIKKDLPEKEVLSQPYLFHQEGDKQMSSALKIRINNFDGRFIESVDNIPKGSALFREKPYASILLPEYFLTHCQNCFNFLHNPLPCVNCCDVLWCDEKCREKGESFHRYECRNLHILTSVGIAHLSLRILLLTGWDICQRVRKNKLEPPTEENLCEMFHSRDKISRYKSVYSLVAHFDKASADDQFQYCLAGIILAKVISEKSSFLSSEENHIPNSSFKGTENEILLSSLLVHHISQLVSNAHAITQIQGNNLEESSAFSQTSQKRIATAIYPLASLMNHACKPSIINSFHGDTLVIHSIEDIHSGDQLFNCYGPHASRQIRQERQTALERQYYFQCKCEACSDEKLLIKEASWSGLQCPKCQEVAEVTEEENINFEVKLFKCLLCQTSGVLPHNIIEKCSQANNFYDEGEELFQRGNHKEAEKALSKALCIGKEIYCANNEFLNTIRDNLAKCFACLGKYKEALQLLRLCIKTIESRYGEESIEVAHELLKSLDIMRMNQCTKDGIDEEIGETKQRIEKIFTIHYGVYWNDYLHLAPI